MVLPAPGQLRGDRIERVVLFGSRARGDNRPDSDIDILVEIAPADAAVARPEAQ